jgi:hypothetical protein
MDPQTSKRRIRGPAQTTEWEEWQCQLALGASPRGEKELVIQALVCGSPPDLPTGFDAGVEEVGQEQWEDLTRRSDIRLSDPVRVTLEAVRSVKVTEIGGASVTPWGPGEVAVDPEAWVRGTAKGCPSGSQVHLVLHPAGTDRWLILQDRAEVKDGEEWQLPSVRFLDEERPLSSRFEVLAVVTRSQLPRGPVEKKAWARRAILVSPPVRVYVAAREAEAQRAGASSLWITRIGRQQIGGVSGGSAKQGDEVAGGLRDVPYAAHLYVVVRPSGTHVWYALRGEAQKDSRFWRHPDLQFQRPGSEERRAFEVRAAVSSVRMPLGWLDYEALSRIVCAWSPAVEVVLQSGEVAAVSPIPPDSSGGGTARTGLAAVLAGTIDRGREFMQDYLLAVLVVLSALFLWVVLSLLLLAKRPGWVHAVYRPIVELVDGILAGIPSRNVRKALQDSLIGAGVLSVLLYLMYSFFHTYAGMLEAVLKFSSAQSPGMAKLVMGSTALAGVIVHFMLDFSGVLSAITYAQREPSEEAEQRKTVFAAAWPILVVVAFCLWGFQAAVIGTYFGSRSGLVSSYVIGALFGFFFSCIETTGFWLATRLLFPSITVWPTYSFSVPAQLLCRAAEDRLPTTVQITAVDGQPSGQSQLAVGDAARVEGTVSDLPIGIPVWVCSLDAVGARMVNSARCAVLGNRWEGIVVFGEEGEPAEAGTEYHVRAVVSAVDPMVSGRTLTRSRDLRVVRRSE